ncbi:MAG: hypothetical protein U9R38_04760 [Candidatus Margulisiibacteriota bacterium]|nr:hypothetical protein [Candidatus Margulisiibacteriota bacterium]
MIATTLPSRVRTAVRKYNNSARSPYATVRFARKRPGFVIPTAAVGIWGLGAIAPGAILTVLSGIEVIVDAKNIVEPSKKPEVRFSTAKAIGAAGVAVGGALLLAASSFAAAAIGTIGVVGGFLTLGVEKLVRFVKKRKSINQLKSLVKNDDDITALKRELDAQKVPHKLQVKLLKKLKIGEVVV